MGDHKKIIRWAIAIGGALLILLLASLIILPRFLNLESTRDKIQTALSEAVSGEVRFETLHLSILPRPLVVINGMSLSIPEKVKGDLESLTVYPRLLPLITGKIRIDDVRIKGPAFNIHMPPAPVKPEKETEKTSFDEIDKQIGLIFTRLTENVPGLDIKISDGKLNLLKDKTALFQFEDINGRIHLPPDDLEMDIACQSNLWERFSLEAQVEPEALTGKGTIVLTKFYPHKAASHFLEGIPYRIGESEMNLNLTVKVDGTRTLEGDLEGSFPLLAISHGDKDVVLKGKDLKASFQANPEKMSGAIQGLTLDYPRFTLSGAFLMDQTTPHVQIDIDGRDVDVVTVREAALALLGDNEDVREIFDIVRGGQVPKVTVTARGSTFNDLGDLQNITLEGTMSDGNIFIPDINLNIEDANGTAVISKGVLQGENLEGRHGNSRGYEAALKIGLESENDTLHLDTMVQADLTQLPPVLKDLIEDKSFIKEIGLLKGLEGEATGRLILGETTKDVKVNVDVSAFNLSTTYQRLPHPIKMSGDGFKFSETGIAVENVGVNLGKSSLTGLSGRLSLNKAMDFEASLGKSKIIMGEYFSWVKSTKVLKKLLSDFQDIKGTVLLNEGRVEGPLLKLKKWKYGAIAEIKTGFVKTSLLPAPLTISGGTFKKKIVSGKETVSYQDLRIKMLDASLKLSGSTTEYVDGINNLDMTIEGELLQKTVDWFSKAIHLSKRVQLEAPIRLSQGRLRWVKGKKTLFKGRLGFKQDAHITMDLELGPERFMQKLHIQDNTQESRFAFDIHFPKKTFDMAFKGHLTRTTLNKILIRDESSNGWLKGDFQARILWDQLSRSSIQGTLEAKNIIFPYVLDDLLMIDSLSLKAEKDRIDIESAVVTYEKIRLGGKGNVMSSPEGFILDMDLSTDRIDLKEIEKKLKPGKGKKDEKKATGLWDLPVRGTLRFKIEKLTYDPLTWSPLHAEISFQDRVMNVAIQKTEMCGISMPGDIKVTEKGLSLDFHLKAQKRELLPTATCISKEATLMTGTFDMDGEVKAQGKPGQLIESMSGRFEFLAENGIIRRSLPMQELLTYLNFTNLFKGNLPDMDKEEFPYKTIKLTGDLKEGKILLKKGYVDSVSMQIFGSGETGIFDRKINYTLLVAPFRDVDSILKKIPVIGYLTGGNLTTVAVKIEGDLKNPKVSTMPAEAVGEGLIGFAKRTIGLPFKILEPAREERKANKKTKNETKN